MNTPWKLEGFVSEAGNLVQHIIPTDDLYEHELTPTCWCQPKIDEAYFIAVHNSADQREAFERGERKPIMNDRELMQQALDALEEGYQTRTPEFKNAITALRERLAQPEQEPVAWMGAHDKTDLYYRKPPQADVVPLYTTPQPQMQHCAGRNCGSTNPNLHSAECFEDYEKSTGMSQWKGLTDDEIIDVLHPLVMADLPDEATDYEIARAIEAKLKEKNA